MPTVLDLFSGTGSVSKVVSELGHTVVSLDRDLPADIKTDIMEWNYKSLPSGIFDFIWASPPCTEYSKAKTTGIRKLDEANNIVKRTLEIIEYYKPKYYVLENPQTGLLKEQEFMKDLKYVDVDYCKYGFSYRKRTRLWCNFDLQLQPLCNRDCDSMNPERTRHIAEAQRVQRDGTRKDQQELYKIPDGLIRDIFASTNLIPYTIDEQ